MIKMLTGTNDSSLSIAAHVCRLVCDQFMPGGDRRALCNPGWRRKSVDRRWTTDVCASTRLGGDPQPGSRNQITNTGTGGWSFCVFPRHHSIQAHP